MNRLSAQLLDLTAKADAPAGEQGLMLYFIDATEPKPHVAERIWREVSERLSPAGAPVLSAPTAS